LLGGLFGLAERLRGSLVGDFVARLDDVKGKDLNEIGYEFNLLANELQDYKFRFEKREKELLSLINSIPQGLILFDENSKVVVSNQAISEMFPYFNIEAPLASLSIPLLSSFLNKAREERTSQREILSESGKGKGRFFEVTYIPLFRSNWALSIVDVSVEKNLERIKYDLVANVSHELRTPMSAISSMMDVVDEEENPEKKKEFLLRIRNQVERINALLNDLLSLSRIEGGDYELKYEEINIKDMLEQIFISVEPLVKKKQITLKPVIPEKCKIVSDYVLLESILKNIIENGIKYNRHNGILTVEVSQSEKETTFEIEDTGEGVPEEYRERIFERFFRIDEHRSKNSGGTGLGLAIVKHSVKLLNGEIDLKSEIGRGSKFTIKIPKEEIVAKSQ
ncbi:MAG: ATP-binding protein, partial [Acidobacteria bacterium]|nr:ATP-binding protein [Acidobacteriota bacterium]